MRPQERAEIAVAKQFAELADPFAQRDGREPLVLRYQQLPFWLNAGQQVVLPVRSSKCCYV
jgi:hypothetical protein